MKIKQYAPYIIYFVFVVSLLSSLISLSLSIVFHFTPCVLCWYQRICMYPIAVISAVSIMRKHKDLQYYVLPLSIVGFIIALYQNLLIWGILSEAAAPCTAGVSCITQPVTLFGFVTVPFGSMISFAFLTISMLLYAKVEKDKKNADTKKKLK